MRVSRFLAAAGLGLTAAIAQAADPDQAIRKGLAVLQPDLPIESIAETPMAGLYQVQLKGGRVLYSSADAQFVLQGFLFQVKDGKTVNLTEQAESQGVAKVINAIPAKEMVVFPADAKVGKKTHITVFTDTDCGYCQKLHEEVPELNRRGIEVRYVAFPRQGAGSHAYNTLVSVWCAKDPREAMNLAKARKSVPAAQCDNPIDAQYRLGQMIGVQGTPAIVLANGQMIPGYQPAPQLSQAALAAK